MIVVVAGVKRSGTTWIFNVARVALGNPALGEYDLFLEQPDRNLLIKSHWWHPDLADAADVILSSERDIEQVYYSLERFWGRAPSGVELAKIVEHHRRWHAVAHYRMDYADLLSDPLTVTKAIVGTLGADADPAEVVAEVEAIDLPAEGRDPVTFYFANHRTSA